MKIRWKLLLLLLAIAMLPLLVVGLADRYVIRQLGQDLASEMREDLTRSAELELERALHSYTRLLDRERRLVEQLLRRQADAAQRLLAGEEPADERPVYFADDFDAAIAGTPLRHPPPGLAASEEHAAWTADGTLKPQMVSREAQVIRLAPDVNQQDVADDIHALAGMTEVYRSLNAAYPDAILWQYTSLQSGVHSSYPGKGGYPADYEPRLRQWYWMARLDGEPQWISPVADVSTGRAMLTAAMPVNHPDGSFAGVTAIDSPVERVLIQARLMSEWSAKAEMMLIFLATQNECRLLGVPVSDDEFVPIIFAESSAGQEKQDWRQRHDYRPLTTDNGGELRMVVGDMHQKLLQARTVSYHGRTEVWAYGPIDREDERPAFLLLAIPQEHIVQRAAAVEAKVIDRMWLGMAGKAVVLVIVVIAVVLLAWKGAYAVTNPVAELAQTAHRIAEGDLEARVAPCKTTFELAELARAFNTMVPKLRDRMRIRQSLHVAMEVQQSLLPEGPPKVEGLDIAGHSIYCDETGGDYYDFLQFEQLGPDRVGVVVGDVVGHGVAAALLMATARASLRSRASMTGSLQELFTDVNRQLCDSQFTGRFMTLFYMVMDTQQQSIRYLSAGHDPAIVFDPDSGTFNELRGGDIPLGLEPDWRFHEFSADNWRSGQVIVLGTDGIWECFNENHKMFGKDRLRQIIRQYADRSADAISHAIQEAVAEFRGQADQTDDITLVVVKID